MLHREPWNSATTPVMSVGDLPGIVDRLDYVASLGVDAIWVSPFF